MPELEKEESVEHEDLIREGEELLAKEEEEESKEESEEEEEKEEQPPPSDVSARLDALESSVAEKDAEIVFLRGQLSRQRPAEKTEDKTLDAALAIDRKALAAKLTDKDPEVGVAAILDLIDKVAEHKLKGVTEQTRNLVAGNDLVRSSMEADRNAVIADFEDYAGDDSPHQAQFMKLLQASYDDLRRSTGQNYVKGGLYHCASTAKMQIDRELAKKNGSRNGVTRVRPTDAIPNAVESSTGDYAKAKTISAIPDSALSPKDKAAAKAFVKRMGIKETEWITNWAENERNA